MPSAVSNRLSSRCISHDSLAHIVFAITDRDYLLYVKDFALTAPFSELVQSLHSALHECRSWQSFTAVRVHEYTTAIHRLRHVLNSDLEMLRLYPNARQQIRSAIGHQLYERLECNPTLLRQYVDRAEKALVSGNLLLCRRAYDRGSAPLEAEAEAAAKSALWLPALSGTQVRTLESDVAVVAKNTFAPSAPHVEIKALNGYAALLGSATEI